jgi:hypothetical protein
MARIHGHKVGDSVISVEDTDVLDMLEAQQRQRNEMHIFVAGPIG